MITITKQWLQQKIADMEAARDEIPFGLYEDDSNTLAAMKLALASLEAEAVAFRSKLRPPTAIGSERWDYTDHRQPDAFELENCVIERLYTAPPAPVSVPDELAGKSFNYIANKFQVSTSEAQWILVGWNACLSAMLQGAEPVKTVCKLPELTDSQCLEFLAVAFRHASIKGDIEFDDIRLGLKMALESAPQQEVKP